MRRSLGLLLAAVLTVAACGAEPSGSVDGSFLRYSYEPGTSLSYDIESVMFMDMTMTGFPGASDVSMAMNVDQRLDYSIGEGPTPGTVELTLHQAMTGGSGSVTALGETQYLTPGELGVVESEIVIVLDELGNLVEAALDGNAIPLDLLGGDAGFGANAFNQPQHGGPVLPDFPVGVGDEWKSEEAFGGFGFEVIQRGRHEVIAEEVHDRRDVVIILSEVTIERTEFDLIEIMEGLMASGYEDPAMSAAELESAMALFQGTGLEMSLEVEKSQSEMTTWFDPAAGVVVRNELEMPMTMTIHMSGIPEVPGDVEMQMTIDLAQTSTLR